MTPEKFQPEKGETTEETVQRFIGFTKHPFEAQISASLDTVVVEWEHHMDTLYGNEERMRVNKDESLRGVKYIQEKLEHALAQGGIAALKIEFLKQALNHTNIESMGEKSLPAIKRILNFK